MCYDKKKLQLKIGSYVNKNRGVYLHPLILKTLLPCETQLTYLRVAFSKQRYDAVQFQSEHVVFYGITRNSHVCGCYYLSNPIIPFSLHLDS